MNELITIDASTLPVIEWRDVRVVTTETLAAGYAVDEANIRMNLSNNRDRFIEGVHVITLKSDALRLFRNQVKDICLVNKHTASLTLWTEKEREGLCVLHDDYIRMLEANDGFPSMPTMH